MPYGTVSFQAMAVATAVRAVTHEPLEDPRKKSQQKKMKPKIQPMKRWCKFAFFENVSKHVRTCVPVSTGFGL